MKIKVFTGIELQLLKYKITQTSILLTEMSIISTDSKQFKRSKQFLNICFKIISSGLSSLQTTHIHEH